MKTIQMTGKELALLNESINDTRAAYKAMLPRPGFNTGADDNPGEASTPSAESLLAMTATMQMVTMFDTLQKDFDGVSFFDAVRKDAPCKLVAFTDVVQGTDENEDTMTMTWDGDPRSSANLLFLAIYQHHMRIKPLNIPLFSFLERLD
ncbi:hypothetical protein [Vreelandella neptunia]|uniref:hypothetical protein n=1 Tax=Vreelandella neptunia TaxID=115551 RepID=UPI003159D9BC